MACTLNQEASTVYLAYHEPYSLEQHPTSLRAALPYKWRRCRSPVLGQTLDSRGGYRLGRGAQTLLLVANIQAKQWHPTFSRAFWSDSWIRPIQRQQNCCAIPASLRTSANALHLKCMVFILIRMSLPADCTFVEGKLTKCGDVLLHQAMNQTAARASPADECRRLEPEP